MEKAEGRNQTPIAEFIVLGFGGVPELQPLLFLLFLLIYIVTLATNALVIVLVVTDQQLQTPMYFFLGNLSCSEVCFSSTILPRLLASLLTGDRSVSVVGCMVQVYFFGVITASENLLLIAMSYDRYLAICNPLRYAALMNGRVCSQLVAGSWVISFLCCTMVDVFLFQLRFCDSKEIDHYFCDFMRMVKLACSDTRTVQLLAFAVSAFLMIVACLLILVSYICIITTILRIPSAAGRQKAFSTCSSHLIVVALYYGIPIMLYVVPVIIPSELPHKIFSAFCSLLLHMINPIIYTLRNKEVNESLRKAVSKLVAARNIPRFGTNNCLHRIK
ncbi:olfactory receptor 5G9-like [Carettochelys insculpta]|uniref:olfactory receptor 5G9-like n=1 Tax=Carettochelys insculpta TaxID=44489 RepID=UPI003EB9A513